MSEEVLQKAFASTEAVLVNVKADQLDSPTPCASWTVRDLISHVVGGASFFSVIAETGKLRVVVTRRLTSPTGTSTPPSKTGPERRSPPSALMASWTGC